MGHLGQTAALCAGSDCLQQLNYCILCASIAKMCRSICGKPMNQTHSDPLWQQWSYVLVFIFHLPKQVDRYSCKIYVTLMLLNQTCNSSFEGKCNKARTLLSVHFCLFYHFLRLSVVYTANVKSLLWHLCLCFHCTSHHILVSLLCSSCIWNYLPWCRSKNNMCVGFPPNVPNYEENVFTYLGTKFHFNSWAKHCFSLLE